MLQLEAQGMIAKKAILSADSPRKKNLPRTSVNVMRTRGVADPMRRYDM